jgi:hypothetical protein
MSATLTAPPAGRDKGSRNKAVVPVAQPPRVSLMPPELGERNRQLGVQRGLRLIMFMVAVLVAAGVAAAWYYSFSTSLALSSENTRTTALQAQRADHKAVQDAMDDVELGAAAIQVGGSTEIDLLDYLAKVQASLPAGVRLDVFKIESASVLSSYPQSTVPLEGPRIATLSFTAVSPGLPEVPVWLDGLTGLPGYVDAVPGSVVRLDDGSYTVEITMHINADAYSNRMQEEAARADQIGKGDDDKETDK